MSSTSMPLFDTRRAAHERTVPTREQTCKLIVQFARARGAYGLTADELSATWGCSHNHVAPRISELKRAGLLALARCTRPTRTGSPAHVYVLPEFAPERVRADG
jgi:hypothetical protein